MSWRGSVTVQDKILSSLILYIVPLLEVIFLGGVLFRVLPPFKWLFLPLAPLVPIYFYSYGGLAVVELAVFMGLYIGVVRNYKLSHLLRYYAMQALLLSIFAVLCKIVLQLLGITQVFAIAGGSGELLGDTLASIVFLAVVAASVYSIVEAFRGRYAKIPVISDAVSSQVG